jgi:hypothetical protein
MPLALAIAGHPNAAHLAMPGAVVGGWHRVPEPGGMAVLWCEIDRPVTGRVTLWRSRQAADDGDYFSAMVWTIDAFARAIAPPSVSQDTAAALVARVKELSGSVSLLTERLVRVEGNATLPADLRLVAAIATASRGASFTLVELLDHGHRVEPAVLVAIQEACGQICARRAGIRLAKLAKSSIPGFQVERLGSERLGAIWKINCARV